MSHTIVQHWWRDEAMEYVVQLAVNINITVNEDDTIAHSQWDQIFYDRKIGGFINQPFKYEDFKNNIDIIATLNGYNLDIDKFKSLDPVIQTKIIYNILEKIYGDDLLIVGNAHVDLIFGLISSNKVVSIFLLVQASIR